MNKEILIEKIKFADKISKFLVNSNIFIALVISTIMSFVLLMFLCILMLPVSLSDGHEFTLPFFGYILMGIMLLSLTGVIMTGLLRLPLKIINLYNDIKADIVYHYKNIFGEK